MDFRIFNFEASLPSNLVASFLSMTNKTTNKTNSGALVRQRTIPTERPPLVGEVSANFGG
jgi:hypothetical protein